MDNGKSTITVGGRFNNSTLAWELLYALSNLIVLFNDLLMCSGKRVHVKFSRFESKIKVWLTVVEYTEALFEISAKKLWGQSGKWAIIAIVQIFKTVLRLLLVHLHKERVTKSPPIQPLDREKLKEPGQEQEQEQGHRESAAAAAAGRQQGFILKRSGTIVRSVRGAGSPYTRVWEPLSSGLPLAVDAASHESRANGSSPPSERNLILAESLYVVKPLFHLGCMSLTGEKRWPPWLLSLAIDLLSLKIVSLEVARNVSLSKAEKKEIFRRRLALLLYILKSPFYDKYSSVRIETILTTLSTKVPLTKFVTDPIKNYLPHWQNTYFYMWSS
ncbi:peroxisomal membrane protein PEX16 isoform X2 [Ceratina calcarata]|uniref:Peroxisomal membrane protein PEX16 n=1 Tax=Ceratina calcarata TaxID=156304 RepID=A0AAJ7J3Q9_9HYME|nr:peroxisomal membrane protein PEX16 isoform X2 [Ceratina calcarata]